MHADGERFVREVNHPRCKVMYDTFHSNIEEKCTAPAIYSGADVMHHVHISENDRGAPGSGNFRWCANFEALKQVGYNGWIVVEAFPCRKSRPRRRSGGGCIRTNCNGRGTDWRS